MDARGITAALGGAWQGRYGLARCPVHGDRSPSLKVKDDPRKSDGIDLHCFTGCPWQHVKAELKELGLLDGCASFKCAPSCTLAPTDSRNRERALALWAEAVPLPGTLGEFHLVEHRSIRLSALGDLSHALRWLGGDINAIVALMTDAATAAPRGVQRIYVSANDGRNVKTDGGKNLKKMLGNAGVIRITADEDVLEGLAICEGVEDALTILQGGWAPIWAASSAGGIHKFPVLSGIEALTIFRDDDEAGLKAAEACAVRWHGAGREVHLAPHEGS
jgi:putative DNA primase/helicase